MRSKFTLMKSATTTVVKTLVEMKPVARAPIS